MLALKNIFKIIQSNKKNIKQFGIKKIGLFGSYIHGKPKKNSDIDITVQFNKKQKTFDNYMNLKFCLEDLFRKKIDLVIYDSVDLPVFLSFYLQISARISDFLWKLGLNQPNHI